jgi:hypothetical protein
MATEVAEHLPDVCADGYVRLLCEVTKRCITITAATPEQGGTDHVNEQPNSYWTDKFRSADAKHDETLTSRFRQESRDDGVDLHRANNIPAFCKGLAYDFEQGVGPAEFFINIMETVKSNWLKVLLPKKTQDFVHRR